MKRIALIKDLTDLWTIYKPELEKYGYEVVLLEVFKKQDYDRLLNEKWDALIWRAKHDPKIRTLAKRLLYFFDYELKVKTFPSWNCYWHYDDKIAQSQIFIKYNIPGPNTYLFFDRNEALDFVTNKATYPIVYKSSSGAGSSNVELLKNSFSAKLYVKKVFGKGKETFFKEDLHRGYVYFQEYLKNNEGDYRIVCFGKERIFGFFRANRPNNKFASGSGIIEYRTIPNDLLEFVYSVHGKLNFPTVMSYDIMKDNNNNWVMEEMSVIYGDLTSEERYKQSHHYYVNDGQFIESEVTDDIQRYFISSLLKSWGWIG